jgi:1-acyl-sn-glycerol-3-phosphate acyltransferase
MRIRSALFNAAFWLWIGVLGIGLPIACVYPPFAHRIARLWATGSLWLLRVLCGITHEVRGHEYIPSGTTLIASKHQSAWDTIIFWTLLPSPAFVLKRELIFYPIFGWYLILLKCIYIDRTSGAKAMKRMLREAKLRAGANRPIVIFPEGTRMPPGVNSVYHPGVAALYQHLNLPVVPVALNSGLLWPKNAFVKKPGKITIEFLPPIAPGMKGRNFLAVLQEQVETASNRLISPAARP